MKCTRVVVGLTLFLLQPAAGWAQVTDTFLGKPLSAWRNDLDSDSVAVRRSAAFALGKFGVDGDRAVPQLTARLSDDDDGVRARAASAIGDIVAALSGTGGHHWASVEGPLTRLLREDNNPSVRRAAAYAIGSFKQTAFPARDALLAALGDQSPVVRQNAAWALGQLGGLAGEQAVERLCDSLKDADPLVRRDAIGAIGEIGPPSAKIAATSLFNLVRSESEVGNGDLVVLKSALEHLVNLVDARHEAQSALVRPLLKHADQEVARLGAFVMANLGVEPAREVMPLMAQALSDPDPRMQEVAAAALAQVFNAGNASLKEKRRNDPDARMSDLFPGLAQVIAPLISGLDAGKPEKMRRNCAIALGHLGRDAEAAIPRLLETFKTTQDKDVRRYSMQAIAQIGYPANRTAMPTITAILADRKEDVFVRHRCIWALFSVDDLDRENARAALEAVLHETDDRTLEVRYEAARLLAARLESRAPDKTVDVLLHMLTNDQLFLFQGTSATVQGVGGEQNTGTSNVENQLGSDGRFLAAEALGWLGRKADTPAVIQALNKAANQIRSPTLKEEARKALERIQ